MLDEAARKRRARKALEGLERDNFHDDPHAGLVMSKKALSLFQDKGDSKSSTSPSQSSGRSRKTRTAEYYRQRFRKTLPQLLEEDAALNPDPPNYLSAQAPPPEKPHRRFCAVCGFTSAYTCTACGARYCSIQCRETHMETRCLKWTV